ncbi:hypothetical protein MN608_00079 [Microdochium nivale]|nr:hypothetical protein MN608_00079 [Microdochium nivale]
MGFWSNLVEGAKSAGGWVLDHSGDIATAVGTVAKIAGNLMVLEDGVEVDHASHLEDFHKNFKMATFKLQQAAKGAANDPKLNAHQLKLRASVQNDYLESEVNLDSFTGVWKTPATLVNGEPAVHMYADLSKWLSALGVPANATVDVAEQAAKALFVEATNGKALAKTDAIGSTVFTLTDPDGAWTLDCGHAYYALPLGATASEKCWHSCIYGKFHPSTSYQKARGQRALITTTIVKNNIPKNIPTWIINATIDWGTTKIAAAIHDQFNKAWEAAGRSNGRKLVTSNVLGTSQSVQVQGNAEDDPSSIRQTLVQLAAETATKFSNGSGGGKRPSPPDGTETLAVHRVEALDADGLDDAPVVNGAAITNGHAAAKAGIDAAASGIPTAIPDVHITKSQIVFIKN